MSAVEPGEVLKPILMRSVTPGANEKVLSYLETMNREGDVPDNTPPRSIIESHEYRSKAGSPRMSTRSPIYSPAPRSKRSEILPGTPGSPVKYLNGNGLDPNHHYDDIDGEDAHSNVQDGVRSDIGEPLPIHEPGPHDPPGPKYESYDSGPSFGNLGPLPMEDQPRASGNPYAHSSWNPNWAQLMGKQEGNDTTWESDMNGIRLTQGGQAAYPAAMTPGQPARIPLPPSEFASPRAPSMNMNGDALSHLQIRSPPMSNREVPSSPKAPSRTQSRIATRGEDQRPLSPLSSRSKVTAKAPTDKGTAYPPLPESRLGDWESPSSPVPMSRARSKAASISPSDSPSQMKVYNASPKPAAYNGNSRSPPPGSVLSGGHQSRPFSPYRHAPTTEDLLYAATRGRALVIPEEDEKEPSIVKSKTVSAMSNQRENLLQTNGKSVSSHFSSVAKQPSNSPSNHSNHSRGSKGAKDLDATPTPTRPQSPEHDLLDPEEARIVRDALAGRTPRTSYYAASLEPDVANHFHDMELCVLLHQESDASQHEVVRKALRKAVRQRVKKLGMKYDTESIKQYKKSYHDHDPSVHLRNDYGNEEPPKWASDIKRELVLMQQRIESLGPKIEGLKDHSFNANLNGSRFAYEGEEYTNTPMTQTVNIQTQPTGTMADSMYQHGDILVEDNGHEHGFDDMTESRERGMHGHSEDDHRIPNRNYFSNAHDERDDSPGQQYLEEELYKLRQKPSQSGLSHRTWEVAPGGTEEYGTTNGGPQAESGLPTIPDTNAEGFDDQDRSSSPPLPALPGEGVNRAEMAVTPQGPWHAAEYSGNGDVVTGQLPPWQRIHARLLSYAIIWPMHELDQALNSTTRGHQVDEVALSIWSTQTYKRYVRARLTDSPQGMVDRLFVPPNMADAISNAVFNGRHGDASGMLKDLWAPFGLDGMPRLLVVLAKHRSDPNHWVVHRFSLPDGGLTTYDSYPERTLPDGRPLGWWFAIRVAWPNAMYPNPDRIVQKMVRLHRPMQLPIDNSVAAAGIWRNILMGSRAERSLDLERLRDLINTEVKNLRQRKHLGKLSIGAPRPTWEDMN